MAISAVTINFNFTRFSARIPAKLWWDLQFGAIERITHRAETVLVDLRTGTAAPTPALVEALCQVLDAVRARLVQVLDLSHGEAAALLAQICPPDRTAQVLSLLGGHLPHLVEDVVTDFCAGSLSANALEGYFTALMDDSRKFLDAMRAVAEIHKSFQVKWGVTNDV
jgi:hypothetical protein